MFSLTPVSPSAQTIRMSFTPRFFSPFKTASILHFHFRLFHLSKPPCIHPDWFQEWHRPQVFGWHHCHKQNSVSHQYKSLDKPRKEDNFANLRSGYYLICYIRNKALWGSESINIFQCIRYLTSGHTFGIYWNNLLVNIWNILLMFFDHLWFKCGFTILWDFNFHAAITAVYPLCLIAVTIIIAIWSFRLGVAQMVVHFCFHHFFDSSTKQIFQGILNTLCGFNVNAPLWVSPL